MTGSLAALRRVGAFLAVPVLVLIALLAWGLASPVGSSPDDDFHLASIWCAGGDREGLCELADGNQGEVAEDLVVGSVCFAYDAEKSAGCQGDHLGEDDKTVTTARGNFAGLYPPLFYLAMNMFASTDIATSVLVMRAANAVLFVAVLGTLSWLLPTSRRGTLAAAVAVTVVPLGMFIIPSTNPSSWALLSASALFLSLLGYFESSGRRRVGLGAIAVVATAMGAGARADAALYALVAIAAVGILVIRRDRALLVTVILPAVLALIAVGFYLSASQGEAISTGLESPDSGRRDSLTLASSTWWVCPICGLVCSVDGVSGGWTRRCRRPSGSRVFSHSVSRCSSGSDFRCPAKASRRSGSSRCSSSRPSLCSSAPGDGGGVRAAPLHPAAHDPPRSCHVAACAR